MLNVSCSFPLLRQTSVSFASNHLVSSIRRARCLTWTKVSFAANETPSDSPRGENYENRGDSSPFFIVECKKNRQTILTILYRRMDFAHLAMCVRAREKAMRRAPPLPINLYNNTLYDWRSSGISQCHPNVYTCHNVSPLGEHKFVLYRRKVLFLTLASFLEKRQSVEKAGLLTSLRPSSTFSPTVPAMVLLAA